MFLVGIFGGGLLWLLATSIWFDYLIANVYMGDPGEPIWVLDPIFTLIAALPGIFISLLGLVISTRDSLQMEPQESIQRPIKNPLFYLGEILVLVTCIVSAIVAFGTASIIAETVQMTSLIFIGLSVTCGLNLFMVVISQLKRKANQKIGGQVIRLSSIFLLVFLVLLVGFVWFLNLFTWNIIKLGTMVVLVTGGASLVLLYPSIRKIEEER